MGMGLMLAYRFFRDEQEIAGFPGEFRCSGPKIGRNERCPCGSGKKYKHCCGGVKAQ
jgi:uncharacterized protein YecA (UPF0149 family)